MSDLLFDAPELGIYQREQYIPFRDCDCTGRVSLSTWLSWMAELAGEQYELRNLGREQLLENQQVFLLSRISLRVLRHPVSYERLTASTWEKGVDTVFFRRNFDFFGEDGNLCAEGSSLWLLCDPVRHRILRPSALGHPVLDIDRPISCPFPEKLDAPEQSIPSGAVRFSFPIWTPTTIFTAQTTAESSWIFCPKSFSGSPTGISPSAT